MSFLSLHVRAFTILCSLYRAWQSSAATHTHSHTHTLTHTHTHAVGPHPLDNNLPESVSDLSSWLIIPGLAFRDQNTSAPAWPYGIINSPALWHPPPPQDSAAWHAARFGICHLSPPGHFCLCHTHAHTHTDTHTHTHTHNTTHTFLNPSPRASAHTADNINTPAEPSCAPCAPRW